MEERQWKGRAGVRDADASQTPGKFFNFNFTSLYTVSYYHMMYMYGSTLGAGAGQAIFKVLMVSSNSLIHIISIYSTCYCYGCLITLLPSLILYAYDVLSLKLYLFRYYSCSLTNSLSKK